MIKEQEISSLIQENKELNRKLLETERQNKKLVKLIEEDVLNIIQYAEPQVYRDLKELLKIKH